MLTWLGAGARALSHVLAGEDLEALCSKKPPGGLDAHLARAGGLDAHLARAGARCSLGQSWRPMLTWPETGLSSLPSCLCLLGEPVRLIRSDAGKPATYLPKKGLRYDGLYDVTAYTVLDAGTAMHRFTLTRQPGQPPIRHTDVRPGGPSQQELEVGLGADTHLAKAGGLCSLGQS